MERLPAWSSLASVVVALGVCTSVGAAPSSADGRFGASAWLVGLDLQQRTFDTMSAGDARPTSRAEVGGRVSVSRLITSGWALGLSGHYGGAWLDWSDPLYNTAGKVDDVSWDMRIGLDRVLDLGARSTAFVGAGVEYGEAHSWLHTLATSPVTTNTSQNISAAGPSCYMTGGFARLEGVMPLVWRTALSVQVAESFYGAHATQAPFGTRYNWVGRSLSVSVGIRIRIGRVRGIERNGG